MLRLTSQSALGSTSSTILPTNDATPLLQHKRPRKSRFYRAGPLWIVPFAIVSAIVRGMTIAPRVQVYTQLSCNNLYGRGDWNHTSHHQPSISYTTLLTAVDPFVPHHPAALLPIHDLIPHPENVSDPHNRIGTRKNRHVKPSICASDPAVQAGAARMQSMMTTTMGLLSAVTSGYWGAFSERHGRTKVLAISTIGLLLTDLIFVLISMPSFPLFRHGHRFLLIAPVIEGLLGGLPTLQSATSSYLSDCTSTGSRSQVFARFTGFFYIGFFIGPSLAGYLVQHPLILLGHKLPIGKDGIDLSPFSVAILCSLVNLVMALFVFPESLRKEKRERARREYNKVQSNINGNVRILPLVQDNEASSGVGDYVSDGDVPARNTLTQFFRPLALFLPAMVSTPGTIRKKQDWNLTLLAIGLLAYTLSTGIFQMKYLYATHTYSWAVQQLSYYISLMGGLKAIFLLVLLPYIITICNPKPPVKGITISKPIQGFKRIEPATNAEPSSKKSKSDRVRLGHDISFDITLARLSLLIDIIAYSLVVIVPSPAIVSQTEPQPCCDTTPAQSEASFIVASAMNCFGAGLIPSVHSLALSLTQLRALDGKNSGVVSKDDDNTGELFGALAVLQAIGQTILAPMLFGLIYSSTVAEFPKAIFLTSATMCLLALVVFSGVRNPVVDRVGLPKAKPAVGQLREITQMPERGRSRASKDLRGGAIPYYLPHTYGAVDNGG